MPKHKTITEAAAKRFKAPERGQVDRFDRSYPGLHLRVGARLKTSGYSCRVSGELKRITLDNYPPMTVAEAHDAWRTARDTVRSGRDPQPSCCDGRRVRKCFQGVDAARSGREQVGARCRANIQARDPPPLGTPFNHEHWTT